MIWLVGESSPRGADPGLALYPSPTNSAGERLCRVVFGMEPATYLAKFRRVNLLQDPRWSVSEAKKSARLTLKRADGSPLVLLGAKVCAAFGAEYDPFLVTLCLPSPFLVLPHPSGRCRAWNDPKAVMRARASLRALEQVTK